MWTAYSRHMELIKQAKQARALTREDFLTPLAARIEREVCSEGLAWGMGEIAEEIARRLAEALAEGGEEA